MSDRSLKGSSSATASALPPSVGKLMERGNSSGSSTPQLEDTSDLSKSLAQLALSSGSAKLPPGVKDGKARAKSRAYLQQCLKEIAYLTDPSTMNPLSARDGQEGGSEAVGRPVFKLPTLPDTGTNGSDSATAPVAPAESGQNDNKAPPSTAGQEENTVAPAATSESVLAPTTLPDVQLWDLRSSCASHFDPVRALAYDGTGHGLFTASDDGTIKYWNVAPKSGAGASSAEHLWTLRGHEAPVTCLAYSKALKRLYSGGLDGRVLQWDVPSSTPSKNDASIAAPTPKQLTKCEQAVWDVALCPLSGHDDALLVVISADGRVQLWKTDVQESPSLYLSWDYRGNDTSESDSKLAGTTLPTPTSVIMSPTNLTFCMVSFNNGAIRLFSLQDGGVIRHLAPAMESGRPAQVNVMAAHPTLPLLAAGYEDGYIRVFDVATNTMVLSLHAHHAGVTCLDIDPSGLTLVSGSNDATIRFWDLKKSQDTLSGDNSDHTQAYTAVCFQECRSHELKAKEGVLAVAYHPSMPVVATAGADGNVHMYG